MNGNDIMNSIEKKFNNNPSVFGLEVTFRKLEKEGTTRFNVKYNGKPIKTIFINVVAANSLKFDVCNPSYDLANNTLNKIGNTSDKYYTLDICVTDNFGNSRTYDFTYIDDLIKVEYPNNIIPEKQILISSNKEKNIYTISIPTVGKGIYKIFNPNFFNENIKYFNIVTGKPNYKTTYGEIKNYLENRITIIGKIIHLGLYIRDALGNPISNDEFKILKCSFQKSVIIQNFHNTKTEKALGEFDLIDGVPDLYFSPSAPGEYTFKPKLQCGEELDAYDIACDYCKFFVSTSSPDNTKFQIYSDFYQKYILTNELNTNDYLKLSMDEEKNFKLTTIQILDTSGVPILVNNLDKPKADALNSFSVKITFGNNQINNISYKINPAGGIDIFMDNKTDRTKLFSSLEKYNLIFSINNVNFQVNEISIPLRFSYRDDFLNNISNLDYNEAPENFYAVYRAGSYELRAASNQILFRVIAKNTQNQLAYGKTLDPNKISLEAKYYNGDNLQTINVYPKSQKIDIYLSVSASFTLSGNYYLKLSYDNRQLFEINKLKIIPRPEIAELRFNTNNTLIEKISNDNNTIFLKDIPVGETFTFDFTMLDEFGNKMNEKFLQISNQIKVKNIGSVNLIESDQGRVIVIGTEISIGKYSSQLTLYNNKTYTLMWKRISKTIDPYYSGSDLLLNKIENGINNLNVNFYPYDKYNHNFQKEVLEQKEVREEIVKNLQIYAVSPQNSIISFKYDKIDVLNGFYYINYVSTVNITVVGEYKLFTFYDNIPINCQFCFAKLDSIKYDDQTPIITELYYIGYKFNSKLLTNDKYKLLSTKKNIPIFAIFRDKNGNEILNNKNRLDLGLYSESDRKEIGRFCPKNLNYNNRQYLELCKEYLPSLENMEDGNYYISVTSNSDVKYKLTYNKLYDTNNSTPSIKYSFLRSDEGIIRGTIDNPARMIVDFRNDKNQRFDNMDLTKISLKSSFNNKTYNSQDENLKIFYGPSRGLITILFYSNDIISEDSGARVNILVENNPIILDTQIIIDSGRISRLELKNNSTKFTSSYRFNEFQLYDMNNNLIKNIPFNEGVIFTNFLTVKVLTNITSYKIPLLSFNSLTGSLILSLEKSIVEDLEISSPFLNSPIIIPAVIQKADYKNSFGYLDNINDGLLGDEIVLKIQLMDEQLNYLNPKKEDMLFAKNFNLLVLKNLDNGIEYIETLNYNQNLTNEKNGIVFTKKASVTGDYFFLPMYLDIPLKCTYCRKQITSGGNYDLSLSSLSIKSGNNWEEKSTSSYYNLFKLNLPVFKIYMKDKSGTIIDSPVYDLSVLIVNEKGDVKIQMILYSKNNDGIYAYLDENGRNQYINLDISNKFSVKIFKTADPTNFKLFQNFIILDSEIPKNRKIQCPNQSIAYFQEPQENYIITAGKEAYLEFDLIGCENDENSLNDKFEDFAITVCPEDLTKCSNISTKQEWYYKIIPSDSLGKYILLIGSNKVANNHKMNLKYKNYLSSKDINLDVISDNKIKMIYNSDKNNKLKNDYVFLKIKLQDAYDNIITRDSSNIYMRDIFIDIVNLDNEKILYDITYDTITNDYLVKILTGDLNSFKINIPNSKDSILISINSENDSSIDSIFTFGNFIYSNDNIFSNSILFNVDYRNSKNESIKDPKAIIKNLIFKFDSIDLNTNESFSIISRNVNYNGNTVTAHFESNLKILQLTHIQPLDNNFNEIPCVNCLITNKSNNYVYVSSSKNDKNDCFMIPFDKIHLLKSPRDNLLIWYEGLERNIYLKNADKTDDIKIYTATRSIGNGLIQTYIGFNNPNNILKESNYNLVINNDQNQLIKTLKIFNDKDENSSNEQADLRNIGIYGLKGSLFIAGQSQYFFIELRDSKMISTKRQTEISLGANILYNVIDTGYDGLYLIEYTVQQIPSMKSFKLKIGDNEMKNTINLNVVPDYPQKMSSTSIHSREIIDNKNVRYQVSAFDKYGNTVCDRRLNFEVINNQNMNEFYLSYDEKENICYCEFLFYGKSKLTSPLLEKIELQLENFKEVNFSNFDSYIKLENNIFRKGDKMNLNTFIFDENGGSDFPQTVQFNIRYMFYYVYDTNKRILKKEINSADRSLNEDFKTINKSGNYIIKVILNGVELKDYAYFKFDKNESNIITDIRLKIKKKNIWYNIDYIYNDINVIDQISNPIGYPYNLMLNLVNSDGLSIAIPKDISVDISLIPDPKMNLGIEKIISLNGIINSQTSYLITEEKLSSNLIFHLPKGRYYIKIVIISSLTEKIIKYIPILHDRGLYQNKDFDYHLPTTQLEKSFEIAALNGENTIYSNLGSYSTSNICLRFNGRIYNQYLDPSLFKVNNLNNNQCVTYLGLHYRGCAQFSIMCSALYNGADNIKTQVIYNGIASSNDLSILIDPTLPPANFNVSSKFPETPEKKDTIKASFNVYDKDNIEFKFLNPENFEIYDNNKLLDKKSWLLLKNNGTQIQLNLGYPPKSHSIKVLFKNSNGTYIMIKDLYSNIKIKQGSIDPLRTILGIPIYYRSGDILQFPILFKDADGNCFEDTIDTSLMKITISSQVETFNNFQFSEAKYETLDCSRYYLAKATDFTLKKIGSYKVDFSFNNQTYSIYNNKLYISSNIISPKSSEITVKGKQVTDIVEVKPGEAFEVLIKGTDIYGNPVQYGELIEKLKVKIGDLSFEKNEYKVSFSSNEENMIIRLELFKPDSYAFDIIIDDVAFNKDKGLNKIIVKNGDCDKKYANIRVDRDKFFVGERALVNVICRDSFNNTVDSINLDNFSFKIKGQDLNGIKSDNLPYTLTAKSDTLTSSFLVLYTGLYEITIYLNGAQYGNITKIEVIKERCDEKTPYMCSNRKCVEKPSLCPELIDPKCTDPEKPFYCRIGLEKSCVSKLDECKCNIDEVECKGMCIPKGLKNFCEEPPFVDCSNIPNSIPCFGTCKFESNNCGNSLACPLGFKICGSKCIPRNNECNFNPIKCNSFQVTCWDYSCATKYENCPNMKICENENHKVCPDGSCVKEAEICPQPPQCISPFQFLCPDFTCRKSENDCSKKIVCPPGYSLCENNKCSLKCKSLQKNCESGKYECRSGKCVDYPQLCPSEISCLENYIKCENGSCVKSIEECQFVKAENKITCSDKTPILCPDLSCVDEISKCADSLINNIKCPPNIPYRCSNNECRRKFRECPTTTTCPEEFPVLCNDGSCQKASYHCKFEEVLVDKFVKSNKIRCSDGTYANSLLLCPTQVTCNEGTIKCWNGACATKIQECPIPKFVECPTDFPYRCIDGTCRKDKDNCSTVTSCPLSKPIKCFDGSCREALDLCPQATECPNNYIACPNGTCAPPDKCSTEITCSNILNPILCQNKKCVKDYRNCDLNSECKNGFLCPDGECANNRGECLYSSPCDAKNPVRCDNRSCAEKIDDCNSIQSECPIGYIKCKSGICKANEDLCNPEQCPLNMPYRCSNGDCVVNKKFCDLENGCPVVYPYKCDDGSCKLQANDCKNVESTADTIEEEYKKKLNDLKNQLESERVKDEEKYQKAIADLDKLPAEEKESKLKIFEKEKEKDDINRKNNAEKRILELELEKKEKLSKLICPDGSKPNIKPNEKPQCPLQNGCPLDKKYRCSDGICVENAENCSISRCDYKKPIKCSNGICVKFASECNLLSTNNDDYDACNKLGLTNYFMCADGNCVKSPNFCKPIYDCPADLSKCDDGTCRLLNNCPIIENSCPIIRPKRCNDGRCVDNQKKCESSNNVCYGDNNIRCPNGLCVSDSKSCENKIFEINGCEFKKNEEGNKIKGFMCTDGRCMENEDLCYSVNIACDIENPILCQDGLCKKSYDDCNNSKKSGCNPGEKECPNKICVPEADYINSCKNKIGCPLVKPLKCFDGNCVNHYSYCSSSIKCPILKPFQCSDLRCVEDISFCNSYNKCKQSSCLNGLCVQLESDCKNLNNLCPLLSPVKCPNGLCVKNVNECQDSFYKQECKEGEFYCFFKGECVKNKSDCIGKELVMGYKTGTTRLLQLNMIENNCNYETPFSCFDGSCRKNKNDCPLQNACLSNEFKCSDGTCSKNPMNCKEKLEVKCLENLKKCNDGLCRIECPEFNGCNLNNPYQCSNGRCVKNQLECLGYSMCPEKQYRCINGECKKDPNECDDIKRLYSPINQIITISKYDIFQNDLVFDKYQRAIVNMFVPANSFIINSNTPYNSIEIKQVPHSFLKKELNYTYTQSDTFLFRIANAIKDSDGDLNFENSVVSPVLNITCTGCEENFLNPGLLKIEHNSYISEELHFSNYCLAKLINRKWTCYDSKFIIDEETLKISNCTKGGIENKLCSSRKTFENQDTFAIDSFGVYAIVIIPVNENPKKDVKDNIIFNNLKLVIIASTVTTAIIFILYFIFIRILRYRKKYIDNKKRIHNIKTGVANMMNMNLSFPGATIGDAINHINFEPNPCYKLKQINKDPIKEKEEEIDRMTMKFTGIEKMNEQLMNELEKVREEYSDLRRIVEKMKKN